MVAHVLARRLSREFREGPLRKAGSSSIAANSFTCSRACTTIKRCGCLEVWKKSSSEKARGEPQPGSRADRQRKRKLARPSDKVQALHAPRGIDIGRDLDQPDGQHEDHRIDSDQRDQSAREEPHDAHGIKLDGYPLTSARDLH